MKSRKKKKKQNIGFYHTQNSFARISSKRKSSLKKRGIISGWQKDTFTDKYKYKYNATTGKLPNEVADHGSPSHFWRPYLLLLHHTPRGTPNESVYAGMCVYV